MIERINIFHISSKTFQYYRIAVEQRKARKFTSCAFVPLSIKSSFVNTPNVLSPGKKQKNSTSRKEHQKKKQLGNAPCKAGVSPKKCKRAETKTCWINFSSKFDSIRCCYILIGWSYGQNNAIWLHSIDHILVH